MRFRVSKKNNQKYYYALDSRDAVKVRRLGLLGIFTTLNLLGGFYLFLSHSWVAAIVFTPLAVDVIIYHLLNAIIMTQYPGFSLESHKRRLQEFYGRGSCPRVAVMIPAAGEAVSVVEETMRAALNIKYQNFQVFVLDDSKQAIYRDMVTDAGARYFRRDNVGVHKKAGNLNALLSRIDGFDQILVLDADFVPSSEILHELIPYTGPTVGIVQSPQHFKLSKEIYRRSKFEYGAALIQRDFYRITQVARSKMNGAICVGTNALYNINALRRVGGYEGVGSKDWGHSEDVYTGLKMLNTDVGTDGQQYSIKYVPIMLAQGTCPDNHLSFYKQQNRWATGSMQLIFSPKTLFSQKLTIAQKLCYFSNSSYYFYTITMLFSPIQLLYIVLTGVKIDWQVLLFFLPALLLNSLIIPFVLRQRFNPVAGSLVVISNAYTFIQALFLIIIRRPLGWEATGAKSGKKRNYHFIVFKILCSISFVSIYVVTFSAIIMNERLDFSPTLFIIAGFITGLLVHVVYLHHMFTTVIDIRKAHLNVHTYAYLSLVLVMVFSVTASTAFATRYDVKASSKDFITIRENNE